MLNQLKSILLRIRENREKELLLYVPDFMDKDEHLKQQQLLALELPFPTDVKTIMKSRGEFGQLQEDRKRKKLSKTACQIIDEWKQEGDPIIAEEKNAFCDFLQQIGLIRYYHHDNYKPDPLSAEDISKILLLQKMLQCIERSKLDVSLKALYQGYSISLHSFINDGLEIYPVLVRKKQPLNLSAAEKFFQYLECRALKSTTIRAYADILLCRALFYAPVPAKKLFALPPPSKKEGGWVLTAGITSFRIPSSFVSLWQGFSLDNRLLPQEFNEDQLSKKIHRLGQYAGLLEPINPSILRISQDAICCNDLWLEPAIRSFLPMR